MYTKLVRFHL